jgi:catechol 2,3-dioxygenase-like lactoylglutathione lyase family enzyme
VLDHVFLSVSDINRSIAFYTAALAPLGIVNRHDYDGKDGPPGHTDLKGLGANGRMFFWLHARVVDPRYYAATVLDPDGYSQEFVCKSWPHGGE